MTSEENNNHHNCCHDHDHESHQKHHRFSYSEKEIEEFSKKSGDELIELANAFIAEEVYGKAVPVLEIILNRLKTDKHKENENLLFELKHHLAFAYGIIGEHGNALLFWKKIITKFEKELNKDKEIVESLLESYHSAALSADYAENPEECNQFIEKGLNLAKKMPDSDSSARWEGIFEYERGLNYLDNNDLKHAEDKFNNALEIYERISEKEGAVITRYYLGVVYEKQKKIQKAIETYKTALEISKTKELKESLEQERSLIEERLEILKDISKT